MMFPLPMTEANPETNGHASEQPLDVGAEIPVNGQHEESPPAPAPNRRKRKARPLAVAEVSRNGAATKRRKKAAPPAEEEPLPAPVQAPEESPVEQPLDLGAATNGDEHANGTPTHPEERPTERQAVGFTSRLKVDAWLTARGIVFKKEDAKDSKGRDVYVLDVCPFDPSHGSPDPCIMQEDSGKLSAKCFHNGCSGRGWQTFKDKIGKPSGEHYDPPYTRGKKAKSAIPVPADGAEQSRPIILIHPDEHVVNDQAVAALANDPTLYQRAHCLVRVLRDDHKDRKTIRPPGSPRIALLPVASLSERLTSSAMFVSIDADGNKEWKHPPGNCVSAVYNRGTWEGIRHLTAIVEAPVLRADGTVLSKPGYDPESGLIFEPGSTIFPAVPDKPTMEQVHAGRDALFEVVADFPFLSHLHASAMLAFFLTPLARHAFAGPAPLFLIDANTRGSGKSKLCDLVSIVASGRVMARMACPETDEETRKRVTAIALNGDALVMLDNIAGTLGNASLDAALTSVSWSDRLLGKSEIVELPLYTIWCASGNNVVLGADTTRRVVHIRLESKEEHPEDRQDFDHPDLCGWVLQERGRLLAAALTILRGYCAAGRPDMKLRPWGSFEGWSGLVRSAVVWAGLSDPGETRIELRQKNDRDASALRAILEGLEKLDTEGQGLTANQIVTQCQIASQPHSPKPPEKVQALCEALIDLCQAGGKNDFPGARVVGKRLQHLQGRVVGGKSLRRHDGDHHVARWSVQSV